MSFSAQNSYEKPVFSCEGTELGFLVNIVFNKTSTEANLVVFPSLGSEQKVDRKSRVSHSVANVGVGILSSAMQYVPGLNVASGAVEEVASYMSTASEKKYQRKLDTIGKTYYFIPVASIKETREDSIQLSLPVKDCEDWFSNITPASDTDMAFFDYSYYRGPSTRMTQINLNLPAVRGKNIQDAGGASARIIDLKIDRVKGAVVQLEVITAKGRKSVPMASVKVDYNNITTSVTFDESTAPTSVTEPAATTDSSAPSTNTPVSPSPAASETATQPTTQPNT